MDFSAEELSTLSSQMTVGFAITYVFGTVGVILFVRSVVPWLLGVDVRKAASELEAELSRGGPVARPGFISGFKPVVARAFAVQPGQMVGRTIGEVSRDFDRATIERIVRGDKILDPEPGLMFQAGDLVAVAGMLASVMAAGERIGPEVESREALSFAIKAITIVITDRKVAGKTINQIRDEVSRAEIYGVYVLSFKRQGLPVPLLNNMEVRRGDVFELAGRPEQVDRVASLIGYVETDNGQSDLAYHALALTVGTLLGLVVVTVAGIPVTLGVGGGVLVSGLCFGWWHLRYPAAGAMPGPAQWFLSEFGLSAFAAIIGLSAGPQAVAAIQAHGLSLFFIGVAVTLVPLFTAYLFGRYVLRLHPAILLGALCGGQTVAAALAAANEETQSVTPVLGFTLTYAISNVLLAVWGPLVVALT
jgi:aspartate-alanine antiporter